jgi:TPR repeat protein
MSRFERAAEGGSHEAANSLGSALFSGRGARKDLPAAVEWFRRSANGGNITGMSNLGECYRLVHSHFAMNRNNSAWLIHVCCA